MTKFRRLVEELKEPKFIELEDGCYKLIFDGGERVVYFNSNNKFHRIGGPAIIDGECEVWYLHGKPHRVDGPAWINKKNGGADYWVNGRRIHKLDFEKHFDND